MPTPQLRPVLARDGIFNLRDVGGLPTADGRRTVTGRMLRGDSLQRCSGSLQGLVDYGVTRVLDLRDESERASSGWLESPALTVEHHPVLDPAFSWEDDDHDDPATLLGHRYRVVLDEFAPRLAGAVAAIAEELDGDAPGAVAVHCAVGKDRTGLVTMLVLSSVGVPDVEIVGDYARSAAATAVQVNWLWSLGLPGGDTTDEELTTGVWSARRETMDTTLEWLRDEYGGAEGYLDAAGVDASVRDALRRGLLERSG